MPQWYDALVALLAAQSPDTTTVTLTVDELAALASGPLPASVSSRSYWHARGPNAMGQRLRAAGWWVTQVQPRGAATTITFIRYERTRWAARQDNGAR